MKIGDLVQVITHDHPYFACLFTVIAIEGDTIEGYINMIPARKHTAEVGVILLQELDLRVVGKPYYTLQIEAGQAVEDGHPISEDRLTILTIAFDEGV